MKYRGDSGDAVVCPLYSSLTGLTDSLPAIALGMEPVEADVMEYPPKPKAKLLPVCRQAVSFNLKIVLHVTY